METPFVTNMYGVSSATGELRWERSRIQDVISSQSHRDSSQQTEDESHALCRSGKYTSIYSYSIIDFYKIFIWSIICYKIMVYPILILPLRLYKTMSVKV